MGLFIFLCDYFVPLMHYNCSHLTFSFTNIKKSIWEILSNIFLFLMCFPRTLEMLQLSFSVVHCTFTSCPHSFYSISYHTISVLTGIFVEFYPYLSTAISGTDLINKSLYLLTALLFYFFNNDAIHLIKSLKDFFTCLFLSA